jgi:hypothetical protein
MTERGLMEEYNQAFNLFISNDEGQIAWTVTPICVDDAVFNTGLITGTGLISASEEIWFDPPAASREPNLNDTEPLDIQSKPDDTHLFSRQTSRPRSPLGCLPTIPENQPFAPESDVPVPDSPSIKHGTIRIYARSVHLTQSPSTEQEVKPSVITVERAALCQIFLETKYHRTFHEPSERAQRRQTLEGLVSNGKEMTDTQREKFNEIMTSVESEWSRLSRVRPSLDAFQMDKKLGSGGFGVVNMVTEKATGQVYAMKVIHIFPRFVANWESISKEKTLRCGHEGRVLCERDLLKRATESGSNWICKLHYAFQDPEALSFPLFVIANGRHLVLEYMPGGDFLLLLLKKAPLSETDTCFYLAEMINAIDACHKLGFMHRDVKVRSTLSLLFLLCSLTTSLSQQADI